MTILQEPVTAAAAPLSAPGLQAPLDAPPQPGGFAEFAEDVRRGLAAAPKVLYPKYLYDALGSRLFEAICELPEYYPTRAEAEIFRDHAGAIAGSLGGRLRLLELGSGDAQKTSLLVAAVLARQADLDYLPIDISPSAIEKSRALLESTHRGLRFSPLAGDYQTVLRALRRETLPPGADRTLVLFLGSTIGNLEPAERRSLLRDVRALLAPGDALLLGADLDKSEEILLPAYDDALGVTAAFNLNLLVRINRELGGAFDIRAFRHRARFDRERGRIEMHIESLRDQTVPIRALGLEVSFHQGETIHTESSYKFRPDQLTDLAAATGFVLSRVWYDAGKRFGSHLLLAE